MEASGNPAGGRCRKGKQPEGNPSPTPDARPSVMTEEVSALSSIFLPHGSLLLKRPRSSTVSTLPGMEDTLRKGRSHKGFFMDLYKRLTREHQMDNPIPNMESQMVIEIIMISIIYKDYKTAVHILMESINLLAQEVATLQENAQHPATPTPIPFPLTETKIPATGLRLNTQIPRPAPPPPQITGPKPTCQLPFSSSNSLS